MGGCARCLSSGQVVSTLGGFGGTEAVSRPITAGGYVRLEPGVCSIHYACGLFGFRLVNLQNGTGGRIEEG